MKLIDSVPEPRGAIVRWLMYFLADVARHKDVNRMDSSNLGA
jgi:hypothetical protein